MWVCLRGIILFPYDRIMDLSWVTLGTKNCRVQLATREISINFDTHTCFVWPVMSIMLNLWLSCTTAGCIPYPLCVSQSYSFFHNGQNHIRISTNNHRHHHHHHHHHHRIIMESSSSSSSLSSSSSSSSSSPINPQCGLGKKTHLDMSGSEQVCHQVSGKTEALFVNGPFLSALWCLSDWSFAASRDVWVQMKELGRVGCWLVDARPPFHWSMCKRIQSMNIPFSRAQQWIPSVFRYLWFWATTILKSR